MWYKDIIKNDFFLQLYNDVPHAEEILFIDFKMVNMLDNIILEFYMLSNPNVTPKSWKKKKYNKVKIVLKLYYILNFRIQYMSETNKQKSIITVDQLDNGNYKLSISGGVDIQTTVSDITLEKIVTVYEGSGNV